LHDGNVVLASRLGHEFGEHLGLLGRHAFHLDNGDGWRRIAGGCPRVGERTLAASARLQEA
jgi:hypothetical protein